MSSSEGVRQQWQEAEVLLRRFLRPRGRRLVCACWGDTSYEQAVCIRVFVLYQSKRLSS